MLRRAWLIVLALLVAFTLSCGDADRTRSAPTRTESTRQAWTRDYRVGATAASPFGPDGLATWGQVITPPAGGGTLRRFILRAALPSTVVFRGAVYAWDGSRATGAALYESGPRTTTSSAPQDVSFDVGGVTLVAGQTYVLFVSSARDAGTGSGALFLHTSDVVPGGAFVRQDSGTTSGLWTGASWEVLPTQDLAIAFQYAGTLASTTTISPSASTLRFGQPVTLTATVTGAGITPTGTIAFKDGATTLGTATLDDAGVASITTSALAVGSHAVTAEYAGAAHEYAASTATATVVVNAADTSTSLATSGSPSIVQASVTFTATVSVTAPGGGSPSGTVLFLDGADTIGAGTLNAAGVASLSTPALSLGSHAVTARYVGTASHAGSASSAITQVVAQDATTLTLTRTPAPSTYGESVTFTATVRSSAGAVPTGTVTFREGATTLATRTLDAAGLATFSTAALLAGNRTIVADYSGDVVHAAATGAVVQTVSAAPSTTTLASATNPSVYGQPVTVTAAVTGAGAVRPTGTVTFFDGATPLGSRTLDAGAQATLTTSALSVAPHAITASYSGDTNFGASTSASLAQTVNRAATSTALTSSSNPSLAGAGVTFEAVVTATAPGAGVPSGTVTFRAGAATLGAGALNGAGVARLDVSSLSVGAHAITAEYAGSASFLGSASSSLSQTVSTNAVTVALSVAPSPSTYGDEVILTARVSSPGAIGDRPTGIVTFADGAVTLGTGALGPDGAVSVATLATSSLRGGTHGLTATYGGDARYAGGASSGVAHTVNAAATTTTLASSVNPSVFGQEVELAATVASVAAGAITGTVTFTDGAVVLGARTLDAAGVARIAVRDLAVANHTVTAVYGGDGDHRESGSSPLAQVVGRSPSAVALVSSSNPSIAGAAVTFTASVSAAGGGAGTPAGTVTFLDGATTLGASELDASGVAMLESGPLVSGAHAITARYEGDGRFLSSTSAELSQLVDARAAQITVVASPRPATYGEAVTVTVTLAGTSGTPTGDVTLLDSATTIGTTSADAGGVATFTTSTLTAGAHTLTASYAGDATYTAGIGTTVLIVDKAPTTIALTSSKNPSTVGERVTLTATIASAASGASGYVELFDGAALLGVVPLSGMSAVYSTAALAQGGHALTARYAGDESFAGSTSGVTTQTVAAPAGGDAGTGGPDTGGADAGAGGYGGALAEDGGADLGLSLEGGGVGCQIEATGASGGWGAFAIAGAALVAARWRRRASRQASRS